MANCMLGHTNRIDSATLSGGSWTAGLPLTNLQHRVLGKVARTTGVSLAATQFDIDLGTPRKIRLLALVNHNFSLTAKYRVRGGSDATFATTQCDTGWQDVWPVVYPSSSLDWEDDNWWSGRYTVEQISGYTATLPAILDVNSLGRYWRIEIDDQTNAAGYLQVGRAFVGPAWQPTENMSWGVGLGWETGTKMRRALGGPKYFRCAVPYRVARFALNWMTEDEGMATAFEIDRQMGIDKEVFWIHDIADTVHALRRRFLGTLRQLSQVEFPRYDNTTKAYEIEESL